MCDLDPLRIGEVVKVRRRPVPDRRDDPRLRAVDAGEHRARNHDNIRRRLKRRPCAFGKGGEPCAVAFRQSLVGRGGGEIVVGDIDEARRARLPQEVEHLRVSVAHDDAGAAEKISVLDKVAEARQARALSAQLGERVQNVEVRGRKPGEGGGDAKRRKTHHAPVIAEGAPRCAVAASLAAEPPA